MPEATDRHSKFAHRVLFLLCGTSPAVVSETLHALSDPAQRLHFKPTRIVVMTTTEGRDRLVEMLLTPAVYPVGRGASVSRLTRMAQDLGVAAFPLAASDIVVPRLDDGKEIADAHAADELEAIGDAMFETLQTMTAKDDTAVFFSLSGGRKSMSHMAGQCMSALARPWDKLLHVIVEPGWLESVEDFFYPVPSGHLIECPDPDLQQPAIAPAHIRLSLTEEPFFRLARTLVKLTEERRLVLADLTFSGLVSLTGAPPRQVSFEVDEATGCAWIDDKPLVFASRDTTKAFMPAYVTTLAKRRQLRHPLRDGELLAVLETCERQTEGGLDPFERAILAKRFFRQIGAGTAVTLNDFSIHSVGEAFMMNGGPDACTLHEDGKMDIQQDLSRLKKTIRQCLPSDVDPTDFVIDPSKTVRILPDSFNVVVGSSR